MKFKIIYKKSRKTYRGLKTKEGKWSKQLILNKVDSKNILQGIKICMKSLIEESLKAEVLRMTSLITRAKTDIKERKMTYFLRKEMPCKNMLMRFSK
mmetsp:Transcript_33256/g.24434  ORF Transcript_33256/g.24434 Transcript_33256/m.24434 type:complete len:97 (-) Transcript_33256:551-841(-)